MLISNLVMWRARKDFTAAAAADMYNKSVYVACAAIYYAAMAVALFI